MTSDSRTQYSVALKGFTLVCVPLIFELVLVLTLSGLVRQAEQDAEAALRSARLIEMGHRLIELSFAASDGCEGYIFTRHPLYKDVFQQSVRDFGGTLDEWRASQSSRPEQEEAKKQIVTMSEQYLSMVRRDMSLSEVPEKDALRGIRNSLTGEVLRMLQNRVQDYLGEEEEIRQQQYRAQAKSRAQLNGFIYLAVGFNVLLAIFMSWFFGSNITRRLRVIIENTERLKAGKPISPTVGGNDEITRLDIVFHDMADSLKEAEQVKRDCIAMVSHDMRTPLNAIQLFLESLAAGLFGTISERGLKHAAQAQHNTRRLLQMIKDLLDLERMESGNFALKLSPVSVQQTVASAIENVEPDADARNIKLLTSGNSDAKIQAEAERIVQVLTNLLSNAIKFSDDGTDVAIEWKELDDQTIEISICDQGRGIPAELHEEIFKRFKQTHVNDEKILDGSGFGLAICKSLTEKHGGTIGVVSEIGKGSRFWLRLPKAAPATERLPDRTGATLAALILLPLAATLTSCTGSHTDAGVGASDPAAATRAKQFLDEAKAELSGKSYDQAERSANESVRLDPRNSLAYLYRGYAHFKQGEADAAIADFSQAAALAPQDYQPFEYRASAYQSLHRYRRAIADYNKALTLAPHDAATSTKLNKELGLCLLSFGQMQDAAAVFSRAIASSASDSTLFAARAITELHLAQPEKCIADASESIRLDPLNASAYYVRSHAYGAINRLDLSDADDATAKKLFAQSYPVTAQ